MVDDAEIDLAVVVGRRVRELRAAKKMNQAQLAKAMGLVQSRISDLEKGAVWTTEQIEAAAKALDVPVLELLPGGPAVGFASALPAEYLRIIELCERRRFIDAAEAVLGLRHRDA